MPPLENSDNTNLQQPKSSKKLPIIFLSVILFISVLLIASLSYLYYKENNTVNSLANEISNANKKIEELSKAEDEKVQVLRDADLEKNFRKILQDSANRECYETKSAILFNTTTSPEKNQDGSVKKYFAVGQYICNSGETVFDGKVRFVAAQSTDGNTWEFTYGSSSYEPVSLPKYIFDTDPALFNRKFNNPRTF